MAPRNMVTRRWIEACHRCSGLVTRTKQPQSVRHRARASQARVLRLLLIDSERYGTLACAPRESLLCVGGHSWHVAARFCTAGERPLAGAVALYGARSDYNQRGTSRARRKRACLGSLRETASAVARSRERHTKAGCAFEAAGGTSHHGFAPMERGHLLLPWLCNVHEATTISAAPRARVASARAAPSPDR